MWTMADAVALVHDYLTQRGGAERVALALADAFPDAPLYTSLFDPDATFPGFSNVGVRLAWPNRFRALRTDHRRALPFLAPAFSKMEIDADVVICSSSGWAHGASVTGKKIVYCHTPARWLYQTGRYLRGRGIGKRVVAQALRPALIRWDKAAAASADRYLVNSSAVAQRVAQIYGIEAEVVPPPPAVTPEGPKQPIDGLEPSFVLCVSRLLPYKNVDAVVRAFADLPDEHLVVAGTGPDETALLRLATRNVTFVGQVTDEQLRWLYDAAALLVAASHEDFGLTPLEAATFGKPSVVLRWGGFLDTVVEGETGVFFDEPAPAAIAAAVGEARRENWHSQLIVAHADQFSEARFLQRIRTVVAEVGMHELVRTRGET